MRRGGRQRGKLADAVSFWTDAVEAQQANLVGAILRLQAQCRAAADAYFRLCAASKDPLVAPSHSDYAGFDASTERDLEACLGACRAFQSALHFLGASSARAFERLELDIATNLANDDQESDDLAAVHLKSLVENAAAQRSL